MGKVSSILVTLTSCCDPNFERSNISFIENELDGVDLNSNALEYCVRKNRGSILRWFSTDLKRLIFLLFFSGTLVTKFQYANTGKLNYKGSSVLSGLVEISANI